MTPTGSQTSSWATEIFSWLGVDSFASYREGAVVPDRIDEIEARAKAAHEDIQKHPFGTERTAEFVNNALADVLYLIERVRTSDREEWPYESFGEFLANKD